MVAPARHIGFLTYHCQVWFDTGVNKPAPFIVFVSRDTNESFAEQGGFGSAVILNISVYIRKPISECNDSF